QLALRLGMTPLLTADKSRPLYHAAAVLAAGGQVALFAEALRTFRDATGLPEPQARAALLPLALGALEKLWHEPPERAITGLAAAREHTLHVLDVDASFAGEVLHQHAGEQADVVDPIGRLHHELGTGFLRHRQQGNRLPVRTPYTTAQHPALCGRALEREMAR